MDDWNSNRPGSYVGEAPRRGGFGRKSTPLGSRPSDSFTLSSAAQPHVEMHHAQASVPNDIDFAISEGDIQYLEIELDPGEAVIAENGSMIWKDDIISYQTTLGDGSNENAGFGRRLASAGMNLLSGEDLFVSEFRHAGHSGKARLAVGGAIPGHIVPVRLDAMGGTLICQRDTFLAAAKGVEITIAFQRKILTGIFGGEGFIMQKLVGNGWVFLHVGGSLIERQLAPGETIQVDTGCVAAYEPGIDMDVVSTGLKNTMFGGEGLFMAVLRGPGKVWMQTLPFSRFAAETYDAAPQNDQGGISRGGETGVLDSLRTISKLF